MIRTNDDGLMRIVTIDRPDRRNALRPRDLDALETAVVETDAPVVLLRGAGSAFCAGADLDVVVELDADEAASFARHGQRVANAIETVESVVVAGIDGAARGGGVELALACDLRVATPDATFAEPGVRFGLFGAWGGTIRLPRVVGEGNALDFALSGRAIDAEEAHRIGLVSRLVPDPSVVAEEVAANRPDALRVVKDRTRDRRSKAECEDAEAEAFARLVERYAADIGADRES